MEKRGCLYLFWCRVWQNEQRNSENQLGETHPTISNSERATLIENICDSHPFSSLLELGSGYAQNFHFLAPVFPDVQMLGVDLDSDCAEGGTAYLAEKGFENAKIVQGRMQELADYEDDSFDLVYTCASLLYIPADDIEQVIREILRIAKSKIFLLEQHQLNKYYNEQYKGVFVQGEEHGYWLRDYQTLIEKFVAVEKIKAKKVENPIWDTEQWLDFAYLFEISLDDSR